MSYSSLSLLCHYMRIHFIIGSTLLRLTVSAGVGLAELVVRENLLHAAAVHLRHLTPAALQLHTRTYLNVDY